MTDSYMSDCNSKYLLHYGFTLEQNEFNEVGASETDSGGSIYGARVGSFENASHAKGSAVRT